MSKAPSPLLGYNNNVRHRNRVFHIQTEDSGVKHPHIITHLFMDGGRILKSIKTSYAEHLESDKLGDLVRQMMKEQHKAMFMALRDGQFDHLVDPEEAAKEKQRKAEKRESKPAPAIADVRAPEDVPPTTRDGAISDQTDPSATPLTLDLDTLERASAESEPAFVPLANDLPPPPANLLRQAAQEPETGRYKTIGEEAPRVARRSEPPPPSRGPIKPPSQRRVVDHRAEPEDAQKLPPQQSPKPPIPRKRASSRPPPSKEGGRYAPARPASIFGQAKPQHGTSIFGEDLISDKSLDEVILSYLAEDLDEEKK